MAGSRLIIYFLAVAFVCAALWFTVPIYSFSQATSSFLVKQRVMLFSIGGVVARVN